MVKVSGHPELVRLRGERSAALNTPMPEVEEYYQWAIAIASPTIQ
ncbi:MAG: hypothetical protein R2911_10965 [Caldilineaceae bacterium]